MTQNTNAEIKQAQQRYLAKTLKHFETMMKKSQKIISSGYHEYQREVTNQSYPINAFIQTNERIVLIETRINKQLSKGDIQTIMHERFQPISKDENIIAIIDSSCGYEKQAILAISAESYPLVLTQKTVFISTNSPDEPVGNWFTIIGELFNKAKINYLQTELLDEEDYAKIAFILDGDVRTQVYLALLVNPKYALKIAEGAGLHKASVYRAIRALEQIGIIECLNACSDRRKYYQLTSQGVKLREQVKMLSKD